MSSFSCQFPLYLNDHNMITYDSYVLPVLVLIYITSVDSMSAYQVQILPGGAQIKGSSPCGRRAAKSAKAACLQPFSMITAPQKVSTIIKCHLQTSVKCIKCFLKKHPCGCLKINKHMVSEASGICRNLCIDMTTAAEKCQYMIDRATDICV